MRWMWILLLAFLCCGCGIENRIEETESEETEMTQEESLTESIFATEEETEPMENMAVHRTLDEILAYNREARSLPETHLRDMASVETEISGEIVRELIEQYVIPDYPLLNDAPITEDCKTALRNKRNLAAIPDVVTVEYAITTGQTAVRSFPATDRIGDGTFDYLQESMFLTGECVAILHEAEGWNFVRGETYDGWVQSELLAKTDRQTWLSWWEQTLTGENCGVAVKTAEVSGISCRMGTVLPLRDGKLVIPVRDSNGRLAETFAEPAENWSEGYLPFTTEQVLLQVEAMKGTPYGWGDEGGNPDCSSTMQAIYRCFGFRLARNTSWQAKMPEAKRSLEGCYREEMIAILEEKEPGTLLYMDGHVVMYVGMEENSPMIFHNMTMYSIDGTQTVKVMGATVTPLDICRLDGTSYYNVIHTLLDLTGK